MRKPKCTEVPNGFGVLLSPWVTLVFCNTLGYWGAQVLWGTTSKLGQERCLGGFVWADIEPQDSNAYTVCAQMHMPIWGQIFSDRTTHILDFYILWCG